MSERGKVLMVYTGGTIGMLPREPDNPLSPLVPASWEDLQDFLPSLKELPIKADLHEMDLIDSSDMHPAYWLDVSRAIREKYDGYDGFVVLHGTDTMTYTASALSFLLENLDKPVVITGSQLPIGKPRNDAVQNLVTALMLATPKTFELPLVPEVCIYFNNVLLRGNRARKLSSSAYAGFESPNYPELGEVGEHMRINKRVIRPPASEGFFINESLEKNVLMFDLSPAMTPQMLDKVFGIEGLKGVVLRTYGAGNAPTNEEFLHTIDRAVQRNNLAVVNVTQCPQGMVEMGLYDASAGLLKAGVISGVDMTPEAALTKMMVLLGMGYDVETVKGLVQRDLRGEQSVSVYNLIYEHDTADKVCKQPPKQMEAGFRKGQIERANIRIEDAALPKDVKQGSIELAAFMNYPTADETTDTSIPQCLGTLTGNYNGAPVSLILDCTERVSQVLSPDRPAQVTFVSKTEHAVRWEGAFLSLYTSVTE